MTLGSPVSGCVDQALGTFRETLGESKVYTGQWTEDNDDNRAAAAAAAKKTDKVVKAWSPNGYLGLPASWDHAVYTAFWVALFPLTWYAATNPAGMVAALPTFVLAAVPLPVAVAVIVAYSPVPMGMALSKLSGDRMHWRWPFQNESVFGTFGLFFLLGWAACILPMYHATKMIVEAGLA